MYSSVLIPDSHYQVLCMKTSQLNHLAPAAQREPIEEQDDHHYASIHTSRSENQEVPRCWVGSNVQSDQADAVFYSVVNIKRLNAVPG